MRIEKNFVIDEKFGLHARPSASFAKKVKEFESNIEVMNESGETANGKSLMSLLCLGASNGEKLKVVATGKDAKDVIYVLENESYLKPIN